MNNMMNNSGKHRRRSADAVYYAVLVAMFAAVGAVSSWVSIPMPSGVPITLQTFGMALMGYTLGSGYGTLSVAVYAMLGMIGAPVFSGFRGGLGTLLGYTGGFIYGFILLSFFCGSSRQNVFLNLRRPMKAVISIILGIIGLILCHICGVIHFALVSGNDLITSAVQVSLPYIIKDIILTAFAYFVSNAARTIIGKVGRR